MYFNGEWMSGASGLVFVHCGSLLQLTLDPDVEAQVYAKLWAQKFNLLDPPSHVDYVDGHVVVRGCGGVRAFVDLCFVCAHKRETCCLA